MLLSPLQAYELAERQKQRLGEVFRGTIRSLHRIVSANDLAPPRRLPAASQRNWAEAARAFAAWPETDIISAYRDIAMQYGTMRIDPASRSFRHDLRIFHRNYVTNFPLPEEQESRAGFRGLWRASPRDGGYQEIGYSVICPLTGRYLMGVNFTIQPRSDSVHFIYGFINPIARGMGFSTSLLDLMRNVARPAIAMHYQHHPEERPEFHAADGPLIVFEKNIIDKMSLTDILMDTARIDIDHPPRHTARLSASSVSPSVRDSIWHHHGGRIVDYNYIQSSLDGIVRVPQGARDEVIAWLNGAASDKAAQQRAEGVLHASLGGRLPGCVTLQLCAFAPAGATAVPAIQIRLANAIFQGISVVKNPIQVNEDIYFQAQMTSLAAHSGGGAVPLKPIPPGGAGVRDFQMAEEATRKLLGSLTWDELRENRERTYGEWLQSKLVATAEAAL